MPADWNDERTELVKARWAEGFSATQISQELGCGISRNAVIGKIHRLHLTGPNTQDKTKHRTPRNTLQSTPKHVKSKAYEPRPQLAPPPPAIGMANDFPPVGACRWIDAHPAIQDWRCCGHPCFQRGKETLPYCEAHWVYAHQQKTAPAESEIAEKPDALAPDEKIIVPFGRGIHRKRNAA